MTSRAWALALLLLACRSNEPTEPPPPARGPRIDACDATTRAILGGGCAPVGPATCAAGFVAKDGGCAGAVERCGDGKLAAPGETCHDVAPCGAGPYGALPAGAAAIYVDGSYVGDEELGSLAKPFKTVSKGVAALAAPGQIVAIAAGTYREDVAITRAATLWGRCPSMTTIEAVSTEDLGAAISIARGPVELHDLAVKGRGIAILYTRGSVLLDRVWVHDTAERGVRVEGSASSGNDVTIKRSLIDRATVAGAMAYASNLTIEDSVVRDTREALKFGVGVIAGHDPGFAPSKLVLRRSVVEGSLRAGVALESSEVTIEGSLIRDVKPLVALPGAGGIGVTCLTNAKGRVGALTVEGSVIEATTGAGVWPTGCDTILRDSTIRDVRPRPPLNDTGIGMQLDLGTATVERSAIVHFPYAGVLSLGAKVQLTGALIAHGAGNVTGGGGVGIWSIPRPTTLELSDLTVAESLVLRTRVAGVLTSGVVAAIRDSEIRDTLTGTDGAFGDGISVGAFTVDLRGSLALERTVVRGSARAGVNVAGGDLAVSSSLLVCNAFDLEVDRTFSGAGEEKQTTDFNLDDRGENLCGCGGSKGSELPATSACRAQSSGLDPVPTRAK